MDSSEVIHTRSVTLMDALDELGKGAISLEDMLQLIDEQEKSADIPDKEGFFKAMRELSTKVAGHPWPSP